MVVVGFFWVHGGIYGNEAMLMAGPPLYVFIMLGLVPFVYSLPIALIVAELSTAFPEDGGYVVWVQEACGKVVGSHHAYWVWVIYVVDAAIYPVLVANYVDTMVPMSATGRGMLAVSIVLIVTVINLLGTDVMVKFNTLLAIISLTPTIIFTCLGLPSVSVQRMWVSEGEVSMATFGKHNVWLSVQGKVAVDRAKDRLIVYLHFGRKHWYFFEWKAKVGIMSVSSMEIVEEGEPTLSSLITEMKDSEKRITEGKKKFILQQLPLTDKTKQRFVEAYREFDE